jgi:hypothetical protein
VLVTAPDPHPSTLASPARSMAIENAPAVKMLDHSPTPVTALGPLIH